MLINVAGLEVELSELEADCEAAAKKFERHTYCFTRSTVEGLIDKLKELSTSVMMYAYTGSTGCSCCRSDNFTRGPYETAEDVLEAVRCSYEAKEVCSQYSTNGVYSIYKLEVLPLFDDTFLVGNTCIEYHGYTSKYDYTYGDCITYDPAKPFTSVALENFFYLRTVRKLRAKHTGAVVEVTSSSLTDFCWAMESSKDIRGQCPTAAMLEEFTHF